MTREEVEDAFFRDLEEDMEETHLGRSLPQEMSRGLQQQQPWSTCDEVWMS